ncbi:hypothetical protein ACRC7T_09965 [Segnochrobactraceae bacterium EtOH-i3]
MPDTIALSRIRLTLARTPEFPDGSLRHGYEFVAPLDATGHIDAVAWKVARGRCRVRRFWGDAEDEWGVLVHRPGGSWAFRYAEEAEDDEAGYRFAAHAFTPGEYVSLKDEDGHLHPFVVASVARA